MEEKVNIAAILNDKPNGIRLYSPIFGECEFCYLRKDTNDICVKKRNGVIEYFNSEGLYFALGEVMLFPSKEMRVWDKFAWKKGDALSCGVDNLCIFEEWANEEYTEFYAKFVTPNYSGNTFKTEKWSKETNEAIIKQYISNIEEFKGGKLNLTTLEIKKFKLKKKPVFELGGLYVFNEEDEDVELTIIGKLIGKNEIEDTLIFGNQYEIENEKFVTDQAFDLRISIHEELREATEGEAITFQKAYTIWEKSKKHPAFKPFDKVLCRDDIGKEWHIDLFESVLTDNSEYNYKCMVNVWKICIPYEGNESLLVTTKDVEG